MQNEEVHINTYVYSEAMLAFVKAANDCCLYLEELKGEEGKEFIPEAIKHLSALYHTFLHIGDTTAVYDSSSEPAVSEQDWSSLFQRIAAILKEHNDMVRIAGENEFDRSELVNHTISEDIADVYQELKDFTSIYSRGIEELMNDAAWELGERFTEHWGTKLLRALSALHELYIHDIDPSGEE